VTQTVYYHQMPSPWGPLFLAASERGVCACHFISDADTASFLQRVQQPHDGETLIREDPLPLAEAMAYLQRYFSGVSGRYRHPLDLRGTTFQLKVWSALQQIPFGQVAAYGEIASRLKKPGAARAVGQACRANPVVLFVPCHRVVASRGGLGGFSSGLDLKKSLLRHEGCLSSQPSVLSDQAKAQIDEYRRGTCRPR
jgi:O-6-methylguanine DNA methyltransferase